MQLRNLLLLMFICTSACKNTDKNVSANQSFDPNKWSAKKDNEYLYREKMLDDLIANHNLKGMEKDSVLYLLGQPNRTDNGHLFYTVSQKFFLDTKWPIHTKTLVIKLGSDSTVEWRKIHE